MGCFYFCPMTEEFLYYIWRYRLFDQVGLTTEEGEPVNIIYPGERNVHSGPDFSNARIRIGSTLWVGNVEIHVHAGDWKKHHHQKDLSFDSVILHVVMNGSVPVQRSNGKTIPCVRLNGRIKKVLFDRYAQWNSSKAFIPCSAQVKEIPLVLREDVLNSLYVERLEIKAHYVEQILQLNHFHWEETFYQLLARCYGFHTNALPFELLARSLPMNVVARHSDQSFQLEALCFGQAGLLEREFIDTYPQQLQNEYSYLKQKYRIYSIDGHLWKHLRMRPSNFPERRLAQFAALLKNFRGLFSRMMEMQKVEEILPFFHEEPSDYWRSHFRFDQQVADRSPQMGIHSVHNVLVNCMLPFLFVYGKWQRNESIQQRALFFAEQLLPDENSILRSWHRLKWSVSSSFESQALLQLTSAYCSQRQCLSCKIGGFLLKNS